MAGRTVSGRRADRRAANWLGRDELVTQIDQLLSGEPPYNVINLWGLGGIGKSTLLKAITEKLAARHVAVLSCSVETAETPIRILQSWRRAINDEDPRLIHFDQLAARFSTAAATVGRSVDGMSASLIAAAGDASVSGDTQHPVLSEIQISEVSRSVGDTSVLADEGFLRHLTDEFLSAYAGFGLTPLVLAIDTYDQATPSIDAWLRDVLLTSEKFLDTFVLVIAGRDPLPSVDPAWRSYWGEILWKAEIGPLSAGTSAAYLARRGVPEGDARQLVRLSGGLPLALELLADMYEVSGQVAIADTATESAQAIIVEALLRQLRGQDPELLTLALAASALETFDFDLLQHVASAGSRESLDRLRKFSFVRVLPSGQMALHELVRRQVALLVRTTNPAQWEACCGRASDIYEARLNSASPMSADWFVALRGIIFSLLSKGPEPAMGVLAKLPLRIPPTAAPEVESLLALAEREIPEIARDGRFLLAKAQSKYASNDLSGAMSTSAQVLERATERSTRLHARLLRVEINHRTGNVQAALDEAMEGIRAESELDPATRALLQVRIAEMRAVLGSLNDSLDSAAKAEASLKSIDEPDLRTYVGLHLSYVNIFRGDYASARRSLAFARQASQQISDPYVTAHIDSTYAWLCSLDGHFEAAWAAGLRALQSFSRQQDPYGLGLAALSRAEVLRKCLDLRAALAWNRYAERCFTQADSALYLAITEMQLGSCYYGLGNYAAARKALERALAREELIQEFATKGMIQYWLSRVPGAVVPSRLELVDGAIRNLLLGGYYARACGQLLAIMEERRASIPNEFMEFCRDREFSDLLAWSYASALESRIASTMASADIVELVVESLLAANSYHLSLAISLEARIGSVLRDRVRDASSVAALIRATLADKLPAGRGLSYLERRALRGRTGDASFQLLPHLRTEGT
jgi:tetratricopeptide (TPR) repeat protein